MVRATSTSEITKYSRNNYFDIIDVLSMVLSSTDWSCLKKARLISYAFKNAAEKEMQYRCKHLSVTFYAGGKGSCLSYPCSLGINIKSNIGLAVNNIKQFAGWDRADAIYLTRGGTVFVRQQGTPEFIPLLDNIKKIASGQSYYASGRAHYIALGLDGIVYAWGSNESGQCGLDKKDNIINVPTAIDSLPKIEDISVGNFHTLALSATGEVYVWGQNNEAQCSAQSKGHMCSPQKLSSLKDIKKISAGGFHNLALTKSGRVYVWGNNEHSQCGNENVKYILFPKIISDLDGATDIAAGGFYSVVLRADGSLIAFGSNQQGECGVQFYSLTVSSPREISTLNPIQFSSVVAGREHTLAETVDGEIYSWGSNHNGECLTGDNIKSFNQPRQLFFPVVRKRKDIGEHGFRTTYEKNIFCGLSLRIKSILSERKSLYKKVHAVPDFDSHALRNPYREVDDILWRARFLLRTLEKEDSCLYSITSIDTQVQSLQKRCRALLNA